MEAEAKEIWAKIKPLYQQFHAYIRRKLAHFYGEDKVDVTGPIPAHLLGIYIYIYKGWTNKNENVK